MINPFSPTVANRCSDRFVQKLGVRRRRRGWGERRRRKMIRRDMRREKEMYK